KDRADKDHQKLHGQLPMRAKLLNILTPRIQARHAMGLNQSVAAIGNFDVAAEGLPDATADLRSTQRGMAVDPLHRDHVLTYGNLLMALSKIISRYGVVLSSKGFNQYQREEILLQLSLGREQNLEGHQPYRGRALG